MKTAERPSYRAWYEANHERIAERKRAWRAKNQERIRESRRVYREKNKEAIATYARKQYEANKEAYKAQQRQYKQRQREQVIAHYGGACACCGESTIEFLALDHINGSGNQERKAVGRTGGSEFYRWIIQQGFPTGYRILCHNCNFSFGAYGYCPHHRKAMRGD